MSLPDINIYTPGGIQVGLNAGVNIGIPTLPDIKITALPPIHIDPLTVTPLSIGITALPPIRIDVTHLPLIDFQLGFRPTRFHFPVNMKLAICAFGKELLSIGTCGESMVVIEDYVPHQTERCS